MRRDDMPIAGTQDAVDLLVVGGGITGAGIALEAARRGLSVHLVEARDFASGTSSRSSKLVHGGLRYLREGAIGLTRESVRERGRLLHDAPGLVEPQRFLIGHYEGRSPSRRTMGIGLALYDFLAGQHTRAAHDAADALRCVPGLASAGLLGASSYLDAKTDDARLVLRVLQEARDRGARVSNHVRVDSLLRDDSGDACGARLVPVVTDPETGADVDGELVDAPARCVINATGAWADALRGAASARQALRPLRGSHLVFPLWRLPVAVSVGLFHPRDGRPVFATPWEGVALVGTTDLDHDEDLAHEPSITPAEGHYLIEAVNDAFPTLALTLDDALGSYAGVRPVISGGEGVDPSAESREHAVWVDRGLVTVTGGKLTTFRPIALDALRAAAPRLPRLASLATRDGMARALDSALLDPVPPGPALRRLPVPAATRLIGRHGRDAEAIASDALALEGVAGTATPWAELLWCARHEAVRHLDDLLLRRTRLGLLLRDGALGELEGWSARLCAALGWSATRWDAEVARYRGIVARHYAVPGRSLAESDEVPGHRTGTALPPSESGARPMARHLDPTTIRP